MSFPLESRGLENITYACILVKLLEDSMAVLPILFIIGMPYGMQSLKNIAQQIHELLIETFDLIVL